MLFSKDICTYNKVQYFLEYHTDSQVNDHHITYTLQISEVSNSDDGLYACEGDSIPRAAQMVHFNSNNPALRPFYSITTLLLTVFTIYLSM